MLQTVAYGLNMVSIPHVGTILPINLTNVNRQKGFSTFSHVENTPVFLLNYTEFLRTISYPSINLLHDHLPRILTALFIIIVNSGNGRTHQ